MSNSTGAVSQKKYMAFIDESGVSNLNDTSSDFWLSMVIIEKKDFAIIEGYLQLLKRSFLKDDYKHLHACNLIEKTSQHYPELSTSRQQNSFILQLSLALSSLPYMTRVYHVDKDTLRTKLSYTPAPRRKVPGFNLELPYETSAEVAITDFTNLLMDEDAKGEIMIESRLFNDTYFVAAFDAVRKKKDINGRWLQTTIEAINRITSLHIANKRHQDSGLEIADLSAYVTMRHERLGGRTGAKTAKTLNDLYSPIKKHAYKSASDSHKKLLYEVTP